MISRVTRMIGPVVLTIVIAITLAACGAESVEVPGETVVVEKEVIKEVQDCPVTTVVVEKVVTEIVEVPGETVTVEVVKEVQVPGETVVVEKEVVKTVEVPAAAPAQAAPGAPAPTAADCRSSCAAAVPAVIGRSAARDHIQGQSTYCCGPHVPRQRFHVQPRHRPHLVPTCAQLGPRRIRCRARLGTL